MALVNLKDMLEKARNEKYAIPAFDVSNHDMAIAVINAAEELRSPVILMGLKPDLEGDKIDYLMPGLKLMSERASVPVAIHLDHATEFSLIKKAIDSGFTSVMFDGSVLPFDENVKRTKEVVDYARKFNVTVEAELGHVGDGIVGCSETGVEGKGTIDNPEDHLTIPEEMEAFIDQTGVDTLAVAIGTAHGVYVKEPILDLKRLEVLNNLSSVPLVMHGGSGTPEEALEKSIELGICKINIFSEILTGFFTALKEGLNKQDNMAIWPSIAYKKPYDAMKEVVREKILLFKSNDRY